MACEKTKINIERIDKIFTKMKCHALGLNEHFPCAVLHGPLHLGGMAIPTGQSKTTATRLNYFMYHIRSEMVISNKLDSSIAFAQLEVGHGH